MGRILIAYASKTGATADAAAALAKTIAAQCTLYDVGKQAYTGDGAARYTDEIAPDVCLYDAVVLGTAMYMGKPRRALVDYCRRNEAALAGRRLYLFTCGIGTEAEDGAYLRQALPQSLTGHAALYRHLGGEVRLARLGLFERFAMAQYLKNCATQPTLDGDAIKALGLAIEKDEVEA